MPVIPIGTDVRLRRKPIGNLVIIGLNVLVFVLADSMNNRFVAGMFSPLNAGLPSLHEYITYQFRHGDWGHLLGNMLFLWIFGNAVCDRMGSLNYAIFYLAGGVVAGLAYAQSAIHPLVGASGAIACVTAAFLVLFPRVNITILLWLGIVTTIEVPSTILIVGKIIVWDNIISPRIGQAQGMTSNVAFSAHLGGYAFGFFTALALLMIQALPRHPFDLLALWKRWSDRGGIPAPTYFGGGGAGGARPIVMEQVESRPLNEIEMSPAERLREDILNLIEEGDMREAARLYERLHAQEPRMILPRMQQVLLANHLAQQRDHGLAVAAYEAFLAAYPGAPEVPQVQLFVGLLYRRYLNQPARAIECLRAAAESLTQEPQRRLALEELAAAEGAA